MDLDFDLLAKLMNSGFLKLSKTVLNSYYYLWVLTPVDKVVLQALWNTVGFKNNRYYSKGVLVSNIKRKTLSKHTGISVSTIDVSLSKLGYLGAAIKTERSERCNKYIVGFRTSNNDNIYLLYYLIVGCENIVKKDIQNQWDIIGNKRKTPKIYLTDNHCLNLTIKNFIIESINKKDIFIDRDKNNKVVLKYLSGKNDHYKTVSNSHLFNDL